MPKLLGCELTQVGFGCMLAGKPGSGKSVQLRECMKRHHNSAICRKVVLGQRTTTEDVENFFMSRFVKRHRRSLGPPYGSRMWFLVDDLAAPVPDKFGTQRPHQLLRQVVEYGGFYERRRFQFTRIEDTSTVLAGATEIAGTSIDMR